MICAMFGGVATDSRRSRAQGEGNRQPGPIWAGRIGKDCRSAMVLDLEYM